MSRTRQKANLGIKAVSGKSARMNRDRIIEAEVSMVDMLDEDEVEEVADRPIRRNNRVALGIARGRRISNAITLSRAIARAG